MEITPTRSALLESRDERLVMGEGYRFLDEKRLLLAAEIVRLFALYQTRRTEFLDALQQSSLAMRAALTRHGLHGLQLAPAAERSLARLARSDRVFFGVPLVESAHLEAGGGPAAESWNGLYPSPEKRALARAFADALALAPALAALSGNLHRLLAEYQRTERRARALEDVILPELDVAIHEMEIRLEEMEQEEAVRVRLGGGS